MSDNVSDAQYEWLNHPSTKALIQDLVDGINEAMDCWSNGDYTAETSEGTAQRNAKALGGVQTLQSILSNIQGGAYNV